jgi:hypothetical protein
MEQGINRLCQQEWRLQERYLFLQLLHPLSLPVTFEMFRNDLGYMKQNVESGWPLLWP